MNEYRERRRKLDEKGLSSLSKPEAKLIRQYIDPVQRGLVQWIRDCRKRPGRRATALPLLSEIDGDCSALIALRVIVNQLGIRPRIQDVTLEIGRAIEREARFTAFEQTHPGLFYKISTSIDTSPLRDQPNYRQRVLTYSANKYKIAWEPWTNVMHNAVGTVMLDLVIKHTGLVQLDRVQAKRVRDRQILIAPTEELYTWLNESHTHCEMLQPLRLPMVLPPLKHTRIKDGGYVTPALRFPVVKYSRIGPPIEYSAAGMPRAFEAINALQSVPYRVNDRVLEVASKLWELGRDLPKAARRVDRDLPPKPKTRSKKSEAFVRYKAEARAVFLANRSERGKRMNTSNVIAVARRMSGKPIWFPLKFDFRSRIYCQPNYLTPQGSDLAKGLLLFDEAVPLGEHGMKWLKIHAANCFGVDKVSFEEREGWVDAHIDRIRSVAGDPLSDSWWTEADQPFQFLAVCFELAAVEPGKDCRLYESRLPVTVDGSCNGIQHLAALSRDADAGAQVNLIPSDKPADIYGRVARETTTLLEKLACTSTASSSSRPRRRSRSRSSRSASASVSPATFAKLWLEYGIDRGMCKRPTMIMPYNGTLSAVEKYINLYLDEVESDKGKKCPFTSDRKKAVWFLAKVMWDAINVVAPGPRQLMQWSRALAATVSKHEIPLSWSTPADFVVRQAYPLPSGVRVETKLGDKIVKLVLQSDTDKLNTRRQAQSLAPNWIHSLDAAALQLTVIKLWSQGVRAMVAVHDSYGTHAGRVELLARTLREVFVEMYSEDQLGRFVSEIQAMVPGVELPPPPPKGSLDVREVERSRYFFA